MNRRGFLTSGAASLAAVSLGGWQGAGWQQAAPESDRVVMYGDGLSLTPQEYTRLLDSLVSARVVKSDYYSNGGAVAELESVFAALLGKERAVFMPTGTLANHLALRRLAGERLRVVVPEQSHVYNDCGDCCQTLSRLNLLPLASGGVTFSLDELQHALAITAAGRVKTDVGAVLIESPVRRADGARFDYGEMKRICAFCRERGIGTHLDGARIFLASAYENVSPAEYAAHFDSVYVSLYKYFNAASGAILAGPAAMLDDLFHARRMFGGGLPQVWPFAVVAQHFADGFLTRFQHAVQVSERFIAGIADAGPFAVERVKNGSNIFVVTVSGVDPKVFAESLEKRDIHLPAAVHGRFKLQVNETWNRRTPDELIASFTAATKG